MAKPIKEDSISEVEPPRRRSLERQSKPAPERVKMQSSIRHDLLCKLDLLSTKQRKTRSALLEEWIAEKVRGVVISFRDTAESETEAAA